MLHAVQLLGRVVSARHLAEFNYAAGASVAPSPARKM
jgi:hypothetical protein